MTRRMKYSGIEWLNQIPEHWEIKRLKFLSSISTGDKDTINKDKNGLFPFYIRSKNIEKINTYTYDGEAILTAGDGNIGEIFHYVNGKFDYHQRVYCINKIHGIEGKLLYYYMSECFKKEILKYNAKTTVDSLRLPWLLNFPVAIPPIQEQSKISRYLDAKTHEIDELIDNTRKTIDEYKKYKKSLITETVTKGVRKNVEMKFSGNQWIGEIPSHWMITETKRISSTITDGAHVSPDLNNGKYDFISTVNIKNGYIDFENCLKTSEESYIQLVKNGCKPLNGDLLISKDGTVGKTIIVNFDRDFVVASSLVIIRPLEIIDVSFLEYNLNTNFVQEQLNSFMKGTGLKRVSVKNNGRLLVVLPPKDEQMEIVEYLDKKCVEIDKLIDKKEKLIIELESYKKSLIYECVTGKKEI